jgi:hypothetical protein
MRKTEKRSSCFYVMFGGGSPKRLNKVSIWVPYGVYSSQP